jgi:hypothetical protein
MSVTILQGHKLSEMFRNVRGMVDYLSPALTWHRLRLSPYQLFHAVSNLIFIFVNTPIYLH